MSHADDDDEWRVRILVNEREVHFPSCPTTTSSFYCPWGKVRSGLLSRISHNVNFTQLCSEDNDNDNDDDDVGEEDRPQQCQQP
jgi:hypothetical protein